eukprot:8125918-Pyramimonas_sp.AAC.1
MVLQRVPPGKDQFRSTRCMLRTRAQLQALGSTTEPETMNLDAWRNIPRAPRGHIQHGPMQRAQ